MLKIVAVLVGIIMVMQVLADNVDVDVKKLQQQVSRFEQQMQTMQRQWLTEKKHLKEEINQQNQRIEKLVEENNQFQHEVENLFGKVTHDNQNLRHLVDKVTSQHKHNNSLVAFSAYASENRNYEAGGIVQFDRVITNEGGFYSDQTSAFLCVYPGHYLFSVHFRSYNGNPMYADIEIGGNTVASMLASNDYDYGSNTVIVSCPQGTQVYVRCTGDGMHSMEGNPSEPGSMFTGILLYSA